MTMTRALLAGLLGWALLACSGTAMAAPSGEQLESDARQRLSVHPDDEAARFDLARALSWQQRWDEAQPIYDELLARAPDNTDYLLGMAQVWRGRGQPRAALPLLGRARALAPAYQDVWRAEISALLETGDPALRDQARTLRERARDAFAQSGWLFPALDTPAAEVALGRLARAGLPGARRTVVELSGSHDALNGGRGDWQVVQLALEQHLGERRLVYGSVEHGRRFGLRDDFAQLGGLVPLAPLTTLQIEGAFSPTHRVRPSNRLLVQLQHALPRGWEIGSGARIARYDSGSSYQANMGVEHYRGQQRLGYTLFMGAPEGARAALAHRLQWAYHRTDRDWVGLTVGWGRETEHDGNRLQTRPFRALGLSGRHELSTQWALIWDVGWNRYRQGYARTGVRLGVRRTF